MPDKKANKNYNISITDKEETVNRAYQKLPNNFLKKLNWLVNKFLKM